MALKKKPAMSSPAKHMFKGAAPREISYSWSAKNLAERTVIRSIENLTGRPKLLKMALGYEDEVEAGRNFWEVMQERYRVTMDFVNGGLENIPREGPLVLVANHPYGIMDGMAVGRILSEARGDFRIIAHVVFRKAKDLQRIILPIDFGETKEAMVQNLQTRKVALKYLADGGAIGIFPGGTVSTAAKPFGLPRDPHWKTFTAKMVAKSGAQVVPVYFDGSNSRLFQVASHINQTLRTSLYISEFKRSVGAPLKVTIGKPLPPDEIQALSRDSRGLMDYLRRKTYDLAPPERRDHSYGLFLG